MLTNLRNLQLITHQADYPIEHLYLNKPKSISKWYAINVDFIAEDLINTLRYSQ